MSDRMKMVRGRVILLLAVFALVISFLALLFSFSLIRGFQRRTAVRSAEFDLQLVAALIEQDLRDLSALGRWCGHNDLIAAYFLSGDQMIPRSMDAWNRLSEEYINNRSGRYLRRLIVADAGLSRFLQVGNQAPTSDPVTVYNLGKIFGAGVDRDSPRYSAWQPLVSDPFVFSGESLVIPFVYPVYSPRDGGEIGTVFLAATTGIITDKLRGYSLPAGSRLFLRMGERHYLIDQDRIVPGDFPYRLVRRGGGETAGTAAEVLEVRDAEGRRRTLVSYPLRDGIALIQALSPAHYGSFSGAWPALAAGFGALMVLLSVMAWGVNRMAREITDLMEKQIAGEKNKRDLEYRMLQSQINPHFLYNTLNSIKWMATIQNAAGIAEMTTALSRFLKTLSKDIRGVVPLRDELVLLEDYLLIQKYRYGGSVNFEQRVGENLLDTPIPRFTLQPLAENAIFHGIEPKGAGTIVLEAEEREGAVLVSLTDDGVGMSAELIAGIYRGPSGGGGLLREVGLRNVDERIRCVFGDAYGLSIQSDPGKFTAVRLRLPAAGGEAAP
jgi:two-component system sensor histidine kinase YesM